MREIQDEIGAVFCRSRYSKQWWTTFPTAGERTTAGAVSSLGRDKDNYLPVFGADSGGLGAFP